MKTCTKCGETKPLDCFHKNPRNSSGLQSNCKSCQRTSAVQWRAANKQRVAEYNKQYLVDRAESIALQERLYRTSNTEKLKAKEKRRHAANPMAALMRKQKRRAVARQAEPQWVNKTTIAFLYTTRQYMSEQTGECWHVDHIVPLQGRNVCGLHVHFNLRVIPAKDNLSKSNRFPTN